MPPLPDLVRDSRIDTEFRDSLTIHSYRDIDETGGRFSRKEHWEWDRYLGEGGFGQVKLQRCIEKAAKQDLVRAVKIMDKKSLYYNRELEAIAKFSNDRYKRWFVKSFGWFEDPTSIFVIMEYCRHGDLHHYLQKKRCLPPMEVQQLAYQIVEGLDQMHQNDFAHRDLKPGNILIKSKPPERWWIVLADFGISKRADESNGPTTAIKGTDTFMAPELLNYLDQIKPKSIADFKAADMWALGEVVFRMLVGEATFQNPVEMMRYCTGQREFPSHRLPIPAADDGREFVTRLMMALPQDRMTTTQCIRHRWMESLVEDKLSTLILEYTNPLAPEISQEPASASAQWSSLSNPEHGPTQTTSQRRLDKAVHINDSTARQTQLQSNSSGIPIQHNQYSNQESSGVAGMKLERTFVGHSDRVTNVTFLLDGKRLVSESSDKTLRLWDVESGELVKMLKHQFSITFSPDGKRLISRSGYKNLSVRLWDAGSGELVKELDGNFSHGDKIYLSSNGKRLAHISEGMIGLWDVESGELVKMLKNHLYEVIVVHFSSDSKRLVSLYSDKTVWLWDAGSGELVKAIGSRSGTLYDMRWSSDISFSSDSKRLLFGSNKIAWLYDAGSGELVKTFDSSSDYAGCPRFLPDSKWLMFLPRDSGDSAMRLWDAKSGELTYSFSGYLYARFLFSSDIRLLAFVYKDETCLWDTGSGELMTTLRIHSDQIFSLVLSPDGKRLVTCSEDRIMRLWDTRSGELVRTLESHSTSDIIFSSDSKRLVSAYLDKMWLWDAGSGELVKMLNCLYRPFPLFSPDGKQLMSYSCGEERVLRYKLCLRDAEFGELIQTFDPPVVKFIFSSDSKRLATYSNDGTIQIWSIKY